MTHTFPHKTRELHNHHFNSTIWNDFQFRDDDIVIATYAKSGTTWVQQIVSQLIFSGADGLEVAEMSPWLDLRVPPKEVKLPAVHAQKHRRFIKTHLPVDALVFSPKAKYLYIGRDRAATSFGACTIITSTPMASGTTRSIIRPAASGRQSRTPGKTFGNCFFLDWLDEGWTSILAILGKHPRLVEHSGPA